MRRAVGMGVGVGTHVLFAYTVCRLFVFLRGDLPEPGSMAPSSRSIGAALACDAALAIQFAVVHSALLLPAVRQRLGRWINGYFYGCFFCVATCACLLLTIECWQAAPGEPWCVLGGWSGALVRAAFYASWPVLIYSLSLTGLGYQTGWTPWWHWLHGRPLPRREFRPRGAYGWLRHPIYLSFLGLIWFTPVVTADRVVLIAIWTAYIFVGSYLKDERLAYYVGRPYRDYQRRVAGYPFVPFGPLGKRSIGADA